MFKSRLMAPQQNPKPPRDKGELEVIPAKRPKGNAQDKENCCHGAKADQAPLPPKPTMPGPEDTAADLVALVRSTIPWVKHHLREALKNTTQFPDSALHSHAPLDIRAKSHGKDLVSYKHPWNQASALIALETLWQYEAGGNLMWCNPFLGSEEDGIVAGDPVPWHSVRESASVFFGEGRPKERKRKASGATPNDGPIVFPIPLPIHVEDTEKVKQQQFAGSLAVISGHLYIYAWYLDS